MSGVHLCAVLESPIRRKVRRRRKMRRSRPTLRSRDHGACGTKSSNSVRAFLARPPVRFLAPDLQTRRVPQEGTFMRIFIRWVGMSSSHALEKRIADRLRDILSDAQAQHISAVVRIGDINGPRGGRDKMCAISLSGCETVKVEALDDDAYRAADRACQKLAAAMGKQRGRKRAALRRGGQSSSRDTQMSNFTPWASGSSLP